MLRNYLTTAIRSLRRHLGVTTLNVLGLGVGIGVSVLLLFFVRSELAVNDVFPRAEQIHRIDSWHTDGNSGPRFISTNPLGSPWSYSRHPGGHIPLSATPTKPSGGPRKRPVPTGRFDPSTSAGGTTCANSFGS